LGQLVEGSNNGPTKSQYNYFGLSKGLENWHVPAIWLSPMTAAPDDGEL